MTFVIKLVAEVTRVLKACVRPIKARELKNCKGLAKLGNMVAETLLRMQILRP